MYVCMYVDIYRNFFIFITLELSEFTVITAFMSVDFVDNFYCFQKIILNSLKNILCDLCEQNRSSRIIKKSEHMLIGQISAVDPWFNTA